MFVHCSLFVCLLDALDWYPPLGSKIPLADTYRPTRIAQSGGPWGPVSRQAGVCWAVSVSIGQWILSVLHRLLEFSTSSARVGYRPYLYRRLRMTVMHTTRCIGIQYATSQDHGEEENPLPTVFSSFQAWSCLQDISVREVEGIKSFASTGWSDIKRFSIFER